MKTTNNILLLVALMFLSGSLAAQSKSDKLFDTFRNKPGVMYFAFSKNMNDAFNIDLDDEGKSVEGDLQEIRFMSYNPGKGELGVKEFCRKSSNLLPGAYKLVESDDSDDAKIWMLGNSKKAREFHVLISGDDATDMSFWISFYGDFKLKDLDGIKSISHEMASDN
ncbi:DUF4252 domain-containing protein [Mangrovibacterium lignilyticum]|uniref:DUF4252 domain-containing protein n=1 Tax=Mangrovibacterium lignilyticum TaxID=2668052 RepID=UPI0013D55964|nr:DUF4252 domain-containing protein [Mangrovibacterium lignilyticum]